MKARLSIAFAMSLFTLAAFANPARAADNYKIDPVHSSVVFKIDHFGVAPFYGRFNQPTGAIALDKADASKSSFTFELKTWKDQNGEEYSRLERVEDAAEDDARQAELEGKIERALAKGPLTRNKVAEKVGGRKADVLGAIRVMVEAGQLVDVGGSVSVVPGTGSGG